MPECDYCGASFDDEDAYLTHLGDEHADELGRIDRRRVERANDDRELPTGPIVLGVVLLSAVLVVGYTVALSGGGHNSGGPHSVGSVHYHGGITVTIDGEQIDFSRPEYQHPRENPAFHFEGGDGSQWHVHAQGVTLKYAMSTLGIEVTESTVTFQGTTYRDDDPNTSITVQVNGGSVTPSEYVLQEGDHVQIVVRVE